MSKIKAGTTSGTALVTEGDTTGQLVFQTNGTTTALTLGTDQSATFAGNVVVSGSIAVPSPFTVTGNSTAGAEIRLPEDTDNGSNYVALKAPDTLAANLTLTLPSADGTSGQVLQTNGSGQLSFATPSGGSLILLQTVTASNSATVSLETGIGSSYDAYFVTFQDVTTTVNDTELSAKLKFAGVYQDPVTSVGYYASSDGASVAYYRTDGRCNLNRYRTAIYTSAGKNIGGEIWFNRTTNSRYQNLRYQTSAWSPDSYGTNVVSDNRGSGMWNYTTVVQGIQFYFTSGNIYSGVFRLYGIKNS